MKISHETYLQQTLKESKLKLDNLITDHRVAIAQYEAKRALLTSQIDSLEQQLEDGK